jgi:hypothetical protein
MMVDVLGVFLDDAQKLEVVIFVAEPDCILYFYASAVIFC